MADEIPDELWKELIKVMPLENIYADSKVRFEDPEQKNEQKVKSGATNAQP